MMNNLHWKTVRQTSILI